ncbi:MAG TPA: hypothetical protein VNI52_01780 [Sphingobacteriaceae bacterium]|nr:hypothetical protein [Sphingobacteriaceae bacterium]
MRLVVSLFLILFFAGPAFSQKDQSRNKKSHSNHEEIQAIKAAYISKKVNLTTDESKIFWPVYNSYQKEIGQLLHKRRESFKNRTGNAVEKLDGDLDFEGRILELKKKYRSEFSQILPAEKVYILYRAEREWKEHLIQELKNRKDN